MSMNHGTWKYVTEYAIKSKHTTLARLEVNFWCISRVATLRVDVLLYVCVCACLCVSGLCPIHRMCVHTMRVYSMRVYSMRVYFIFTHRMHIHIHAHTLIHIHADSSKDRVVVNTVATVCCSV